ncbi:glycoside hydrolase family 15 [Streptomyces sp. AJS327]|uniref:glycoside hydrolase family 15 protein n=1 Tax=Streptomyces sp. AJS327 TaxID=2545265 RepID=UPI0015DE6EF4|nr:glycoside hydrolase family 15 protein [Streptomyces sp. AJS327]MBA0053221.1 glycoside hydrolase family 15 [Streptomyces sp. AJS327]
MPTPHAPDHPALLRASLDVITGNQAPSGAYPACPTYEVYRYSWLRDGSFTAEATSRAGAPESADAFHRWTAKVITDRAARIERLVTTVRAGQQPTESDHLPTRYTLDGDDTGDVGWWDFQLDGYGTWLWALTEHLTRHGRDATPYREAVRLTVDYLTATWATPCYDWWEEYREQTHGGTLGAIRGGLHAVRAAGLAEDTRCGHTIDAIDTLIRERGTYDGHLAKWLGSKQVDGSLLACLTPFGNVPADGPVAAATLHALELDVVQPGGGVYRYLGDTFYGGGQWPVLAGFLGWHYARTGRTDDARRELDWIAAQATADHLLPEQAPDVRLQAPRRLPEWETRWGPNATPLLWSHAMYLILADELGATP